VSTTATQTSPVGTYDIVVSQGSLVSVNNYNLSFVKGTLAIASNPCMVAPNTATNFGSTANPNTPTSLWLNLTTKVSGQLVANGDYLLFKAGTATFSNITSTPAVTNFPIPNGKIVADKCECFITGIPSGCKAELNTGCTYSKAWWWRH